MPGLLLTAPLMNAGGGYASHIRYLGQLLLRGREYPVQIPKSGSQNLSCFRAHLADAQRVDQPADILLLASLNGRKQLGGGGFSGLPKSFDILLPEIVDIGGRMNQILLNQRIHDGAAKALNIHGIPADKMGDVPAQLRGAFRAGAAQERAVLILLRSGSAHRAYIREAVGPGSLGPL